MIEIKDTPRRHSPRKVLRQRRVARVSPIERSKLQKVQQNSKIRKTADMSPDEIIERNAKERERVHAVNDQYQVLRQIIPYKCKGRRMSKESIVKLTTQYIKDLKALLHEYDSGTLSPSITSPEIDSANISSCRFQSHLQSVQPQPHFDSASFWPHPNVPYNTQCPMTSHADDPMMDSPSHISYAGKTSPSWYYNNTTLNNAGYRLNLLCTENTSPLSDPEETANLYRQKPVQPKIQFGTDAFSDITNACQYSSGNNSWLEPSRTSPTIPVSDNYSLNLTSGMPATFDLN